MCFWTALFSTWAPVMLPAVTCNALRMVQSTRNEGKGQGGPGPPVSSILSVRWKFLSRSGFISVSRLGCGACVVSWALASVTRGLSWGLRATELVWDVLDKMWQDCSHRQVC